MAYAPHVASKRAYQRFKQNFRSKLYEGKVGLFELLRHWWSVRRIVKARTRS
jgi:hypothetical protein